MKQFGKLLVALVLAVSFTGVATYATPSAAGDNINPTKISRYVLAFSGAVREIVLDGGIITGVESDPLRQRGTINFREDGRCFRATVNGTRVNVQRVNCRNNNDD